RDLVLGQVRDRVRRVGGHRASGEADGREGDLRLGRPQIAADVPEVHVTGVDVHDARLGVDVIELEVDARVQLREAGDEGRHGRVRAVRARRDVVARQWI